MMPAAADRGVGSDGAPGDGAGGRLGFGRSMVFQALAQIVNRGSSIVVLAMLARTLDEPEVALVAAVAVAASWTETLAGGGLVDAVVFYDDDRAHRRAARAVAATMAFGIGAIFVLAAPLIAEALGQPENVEQMRIIGGSIVLLSFAALGDGRLRRRLAFGLRAASETGRAVARVAVAAVLVAAGVGAWAFIAAVLAGDLVFLLGVSLLSSRPRPEGAPGPVPFARVLRYSLLVGGALISARLVLDVDYVMIGTRQGADALAQYVLSFRIVELTVLGVLATASAVAFPVYRRRLHAGLDQLHVSYLAVMRLQTVFAAVLGVAIACNAEMLVSLFYGSRWSDSAPLLAWLGLYGIGRAIGAGAVDAYKAIGRPELAIYVAIVRFAVLLPLLFWAAGISTLAVAVGQALAAAVFAVGMQIVAAVLLRLSAWRIAASMVPALLAVAVVGVTHLLGMAVVGATGAPAGVALAIDAVAAGVMLVAQVRRDLPVLELGAPRVVPAP